jgi:adenosylhomocysteine nucleosidase
MNRADDNSGVQNTGPGSININQSAIGDRAMVCVGAESRGVGRHPLRADVRNADVGVITVLSEETHAMTTALAGSGTLRKHVGDDGARYYERDVDVGGNGLRVVVTQAADRGQRPMAIAFARLQRCYAPAVVVLVGIAGGIHPMVKLGDVVVAQDVIYYDLRKEAPSGTVWRGQSRPVPIAIRHALNDFFASNGEPYRTSITGPHGVSRPCTVLAGPIGSGEAVVAAGDSNIRQYIAGFNDKTLALETEAGGLAQAFYETADASGSSGWLAVRGISDLADACKDDQYHEIASWHAAVVFLQLLPYLIPAGP